MNDTAENSKDHNFDDRARRYHAKAPAGKIKIGLTKPNKTSDDLSLAYTPGVGAISRDIAENQAMSWKYTNRANTVAVVSDGTAILGLGNLGAQAAMPVMEGKSALFKQFADIDAYPLCLKIPNMEITDEGYIEALSQATAALAPSLGGINLEDIKAPQCFAVLDRVRELVTIPVFHDDQDGTAVIVTAGVQNALKVVGKQLHDIRILINGAGAAGIATARLFKAMGLPTSQLFVCDSRGLVASDRSLHSSKAEFAQEKTVPLEEAVKGVDVFIGVSKAGLLKSDMVRSMAENPIVFAAANPIPEILPEVAKEAGVAVIGTGRSDYHNQINNSLGFPGIFRGVLDSGVQEITPSMLIAASKALASLSQESPSDEVRVILESSYPNEAKAGMFDGDMSSDYVLPKQFDVRVVARVARAVAETAISEQKTRNQINDFDAYEAAIIDEALSRWRITTDD
ncbi:NADP-dependent malic enzyme [Candidatus Saccharibacteria bacterium]|jgi:malate dehydrogenase (oxaloacetate-decarboxylating)(NADP+)|nr:NADP-dependent malic enzyme [Candidatus Saccharibacteria bacterium]